MSVTGPRSWDCESRHGKLGRTLRCVSTVALSVYVCMCVGSHSIPTFNSLSQYGKRYEYLFGIILAG